MKSKYIQVPVVAAVFNPLGFAFVAFFNKGKTPNNFKFANNDFAKNINIRLEALQTNLVK